MSSRRDNTGVPQTCPLIDDVVEFIEFIEWDEGEVELEKKGKEALKTLEKIRSANYDLRDFGNGQYNEKEQLEKDLELAERKIDKLEADIIYYQNELKELEANQTTNG